MTAPPPAMPKVCPICRGFLPCPMHDSIKNKDPAPIGKQDAGSLPNEEDVPRVGQRNLLPRYRKALYHVVPDAMGKRFPTEMGEWLYHHKEDLRTGGDGEFRHNYEIYDLNTLCPQLMTRFRKVLVDAIPDALEPCGIPDFDLDDIEVMATLYHHGSFFKWHDDAPNLQMEFARTRRLTFTYHMHTTPKMFSGGALEFLDGTVIEPENGNLVIFYPLQRHRIQRVDCWSADAMHGRWALMGWVHGEPPG